MEPQLPQRISPSSKKVYVRDARPVGRFSPRYHRPEKAITRRLAHELRFTTQLAAVLTSHPHDELPKRAIALHQGVRLPHVAEVEGARAERRNSPRSDSLCDRSQRRVGERQGRRAEQAAREEAEARCARKVLHQLEVLQHRRASKESNHRHGSERLERLDRVAERRRADDLESSIDPLGKRSPHVLFKF